jgi:hypothetical protein
LLVKSIGNWHGSLYYLTHFLVQLLTCPTYMKKEAAGTNKFSLQAFYQPF